MRLVDLMETPQTKLTADMIQQIRAWRDEVRVDSSGYGMCHEVTEVIEHEWGLERYDGTYCDERGNIVCIWHYWNTFPDGTILDSTADQFGEKDIMVISPNDPDYKKYRPEEDDDYEKDAANKQSMGWNIKDDPVKLKRLLKYYQDAIERHKNSYVHDEDGGKRMADLERFVQSIKTYLRKAGE